MCSLKLLLVGWWRTPLIPALFRQRQKDICEFKASLVYKVNSSIARVTQRNPVLKTQTKPNENCLCAKFSKFCLTESELEPLELRLEGPCFKDSQVLTVGRTYELCFF